MEQPQSLISLEDAQQLVAALERGENSVANGIVEQVMAQQDSLIFQQVGKLTRELHTTVSQFKTELGDSGVTGAEISNIRTRLHHVIELMEKAANDSLAAVEHSTPLAKAIEDGADKIAEPWDRFRNREMDVQQFRELSDEITEFMSIAAVNSERIHERLNEVMMAQGFQDLSGQIIHRVVDVMGTVEDSLVELIRLSSQGDDEKEQERLGPAVPGVVSNTEYVTSQDEVDDLLSSLGF